MGLVPRRLAGGWGRRDSGCSPTHTTHARCFGCILICADTRVQWEDKASCRCVPGPGVYARGLSPIPQRGRVSSLGRVGSGDQLPKKAGTSAWVSRGWGERPPDPPVPDTHLTPAGPPQPPPLLRTVTSELQGCKQVRPPGCPSHLPRPSAPLQGLSRRPPRVWAPPPERPHHPRRA